MLGKTKFSFNPHESDGFNNTTDPYLDIPMEDADFNALSDYVNWTQTGAKTLKHTTLLKVNHLLIELKKKDKPKQKNGLIKKEHTHKNRHLNSKKKLRKKLK